MSSSSWEWGQSLAAELLVERDCAYHCSPLEDFLPSTNTLAVIGQPPTFIIRKKAGCSRQTSIRVSFALTYRYGKVYAPRLT